MKMVASPYNSVLAVPMPPTLTEQKRSSLSFECTVLRQHTSSLPAGTAKAFLFEYRGERVAGFEPGPSCRILCLPQVYGLFLKQFVGGLHTVYTKLKRLGIRPLICSVEQVRALRSLCAIQSGVNRCKLIKTGDFETLYRDCINIGARPGRLLKRTVSENLWAYGTVEKLCPQSTFPPEADLLHQHSDDLFPVQLQRYVASLSSLLLPRHQIPPLFQYLNDQTVLTLLVQQQLTSTSSSSGATTSNASSPLLGLHQAIVAAAAMAHHRQQSQHLLGLANASFSTNPMPLMSLFAGHGPKESSLSSGDGYPIDGRTGLLYQSSKHHLLNRLNMVMDRVEAVLRDHCQQFYGFC